SDRALRAPASVTWTSERPATSRRSCCSSENDVDPRAGPDTLEHLVSPPAIAEGQPSADPYGQVARIHYAMRVRRAGRHVHQKEARPDTARSAQARGSTSAGFLGNTDRTCRANLKSAIPMGRSGHAANQNDLR